MAEDAAAPRWCELVSKHEVLADPEDLTDLLNQHLSLTPGRVFVLVSSDWCPDCVKAGPRVPPAVAAVSQRLGVTSTLIKLDAGTRPQWRDPQNTYRISSLLQTTNIPTLYHITAEGRVGSRLVEADLYEPPERLAAFVEAALQPRADL
jgi:hypothetical protein